MPWDTWLLWAAGMVSPVIGIVVITRILRASSRKPNAGVPALPLVVRRPTFAIGEIEGPVTAGDLEQRQRYVEHAKHADFVDAVFVIRYYNVDRRRWGPCPMPPPIEAVEVFGPRFDRSRFAEAVDRVDGLLRDARDVAMAEFGYEQATRTPDEEHRLLAERYRGFSEESFGRALNSARVAMR